MARLVERTERVWSSGAAPATSEFPGPAHRAVLARARAERRLVVEAGGREATVVAPDRRGVFCRVAGVLAVHGLDILAARAWSSDDGLALEHFHVVPTVGKEPDWRAVEADVERALAGILSLEARLAERARQYAGRPTALAADPPRTQVTVHSEASDTATVVEVRAPDRIGTLYRITRVLAALDLDIRSAMVTTIGHEVVDVFYVVDADGAKVTDDRVATVEGALRAALAGVEAVR